MKIQRGDFGYIAARKRRALCGVLAMTCIGIAVFVVGLLLNKMSNRNIFTVIAVLFALPGARFLVAFIVMFPYKSVDRKRYDAVAGKLPQNMQLYTDLVVTSAEKIMHLDFVAVGNGQVIGLLGEGKQELSYVRSYLTKGVANWGDDYRVKIVEREKIFLSELAAVEPREVDEEQEEKVKSFLTSLIV